MSVFFGKGTYEALDIFMVLKVLGKLPQNKIELIQIC